jgi:signal transduction histidine kinase
MDGSNRKYLADRFSKSPVYQKKIKTPRLVLLAVVVVTHLVTFGQTQKIDSLKSALRDGGESNYDVVFGLAYELFDINNPEAAIYGQMAYNLARDMGDSTKIVVSGRITGQLLRRTDRLNESIQLLNSVLPIARRNKITKEEKSILNALALSYTFIADYDKALEVNFQALVIREREGNKREISFTLNNIGLVYFKLGNHEMALQYYNRALEMRLQANDSYDLDRTFINIGLCYNQLSNFVEAERYINKGLALCEGNCQDEIKIEGEYGLGVSYYARGDYSKALEHFEASYELSKKISNQRFRSENLIYKSRIFLAENKLNEAIQTLIECEGIAAASDYNEVLIDAYKEFSNVYKKLNSFEKSSDYQSRYISLKDSIYSSQLIDRIAKIQTQYEERENIKTIASKEEVINRQRTLNIAIAIIAILATLLIFVLYRSNRVKKKVNAALSEAKAIIEDQNKQLLSSNIHLDQELKERNIDLEKANDSLRHVNDELDNFIYKTSHDIRGPLASLRGVCNVALLDVLDPVALNYLRKLDVTAEKLNTILTRLLIVNQINNSVLGSERVDFHGIITDVLLLEKKKGLPPALSVRKKIEDDIDFHSDREFVRIIFENLIDNAIKFYNDAKGIDPFVDITVSKADHHINISVVDNGIGIRQVNPDKIFQMFSRASERSETGGIGLYITKTAVEKLSGTIELKATPEGYTEFYILLPLAPVKVEA